MKILFVSHDASRTGAPIVLLTFIRWLKENTQTEITILLKEGGPLLQDFQEVGDTIVWRFEKPITLISRHSFSRHLVRFSKAFTQPFPQKLSNKKFDLAYLNTIVSLDLAPILKEKFDCPIVAHIHENEYTIESLFSKFLVDKFKIHIDQYIAVSNDTLNYLVSKHNINERSITLVYEFINTSVFSNPTTPLEIIKQNLGIGKSFIVGGAGLTSWRKGVDWFVDLAGFVKRNYPDRDIKFLWIGNIDENFKKQLDYQVSRLKITDTIIFTGGKSDPANYFQVFDVFALTSREDPFPLVCLESAALGKPVICFNGSGGMPEFTKLGGGFSVAYGSIEEFASVIIQSDSDHEQTKLLGAKAKSTVANFDVNIIAPRIMNVINSAVS